MTAWFSPCSWGKAWAGAVLVVVAAMLLFCVGQRPHTVSFIMAVWRGKLGLLWWEHLVMYCGLATLLNMHVRSRPCSRINLMHIIVIHVRVRCAPATCSQNRIALQERWKRCMVTL